MWYLFNEYYLCIHFEPEFYSYIFPQGNKYFHKFWSEILKNDAHNGEWVKYHKIGKSSDVDAEVSKPMSKPAVREHNKSVFVPTCHLCGVVGHIRPNCSLLRQKPKSENRFAVRNTNDPKFIPICHFCGVHGHIRPNCYKLKFKHFVFRSKICDDISPAISPNKLFHMLLKNLSLLAYERNL